MLFTDFEIVHIVIDYYDGVREGVADYRGHPHYFKCFFDEEKDDWSDIFFLKPLDSETYKRLIESQDIYGRWNAAYRNAAYQEGRTTLETHSALPEERERYAEISAALESRLQFDPETDIKAEGVFENREPKHEGEWIARQKVKWRFTS